MRGRTHPVEAVAAWLLALVWLAPLAYAFWSALHPAAYATSFSLSAPWTLENFARAWKQAPFARYYLNTVVLVTFVLVGQLILSTLAAYAFARFKFRLGEDMAFTLLSFKFAPPILVLLPLQLYFQDIGLYDTYFGLIWVYQLITMPLILWIVRGYFEDISPDIEAAFRLDGHSWVKSFLKIAVPLAGPGIAAAGLLAFIFAWNNFVFALILGSSAVHPVTVGALAFVTASGIQYGVIAAALVLSVVPTLTLALYAQRYLVEGLSLGAVKG